MNEQRTLFSPYITAISYLPEKLRIDALAVSEQLQSEVEEIRLRTGQKMTILTAGKEIDISEKILTETDLARLAESATGSSVHSYVDTIKNGFIPMRGGHRLGLCGSVVAKCGEVMTIRNFSSLNLRIARERKGISNEIAPKLITDGKLQNTLIISPPGFGKTTLLRDLIRNISQSMRVGVVDERCEIGGSFMGKPQFDLGMHTDILESCPKACGIPLLIKAMSPEVIAIDEITSEKDVRAVESAMYCGVSIIATTHAEGLSDFKKRPVYELVRKAKIFKNIITVTVNNGKREYALESTEQQSAIKSKS